MTTEKQTTLATIGSRPHTVRVLKRERENGITTIVLEWREIGARRREVVALNDTARETIVSAKAKAKALHARLVAGRSAVAAPVAVRVVTVADLYNAHVALHEDSWRPNTRKLADEMYRAYSAFVGPAADVATQTVATLAALRQNLRRLGRGPANTVRICQRVKGMYRSGIEAGLLATHPIATARLKTGKGDQAQPVPEFTPDATERIMAQFDPRERSNWRPWALMMLAAILGPRANALLQQEWRNVSLGTSPRTITWPAHTDKLGRHRTQALPRSAVFVLRVVRVWQHREGYAGPLLFPSRRLPGRPYTYAALWVALGKACEDAGVARRPMQALHAFRRYAANEVLRATGGDITAVSYWIGDTDLRVLQQSYLRTRADDGAKIAARLNGPRTAPNTAERAEMAALTTTTQRGKT